MRDNHGWGLRAELVICLVLTVFFAIAVVLIGRVVNTLNEDININGNNDSEVIKDNNKNDIIINDNNETITNDDIKTNNDETDKNNISYNSLEDKLVSAGVMYANKYYNDTKLIVTVVRLQTENMLDELIIEDTKCSGYIEIEKGETFKYYPYIKCDDIYETKGYDELKDNIDL